MTDIRPEAVFIEEGTEEALSKFADTITGTATNGSSTNLVDTSAAFNADLTGATLVIKSLADGHVKVTTITSNTATQLNFAAGYTVVAGDTYVIKTGAGSSFGANSDVAQIDSTQSASPIAFLKGIVSVLNTFFAKILFDANGIFKVTLATSLTADPSIAYGHDTIDVSKMTAGGIVTAHNAITTTATSAEIDCRGFNSVRIEAEVSTTAGSSDKVWTPTITGSCVSGGTFGQVFQNVAGTQTAIVLPALTTPASAGNLKQIYIIQGGIPSYLKITETLAGTNLTSVLTVKAVPFNV